jgi:thiol-disulfide isomerase/thioredoxin
VSVFGRQPGGGTAALPVEGRLPGFGGATGWLNSTPLTGEYLRGRVVLTDFWTYTCINWLRTLTYVRAWAQKYGDQGLVVVGVHTPEFPFEQDAENVRSAARVMGIHYPIARKVAFDITSSARADTLDRDFAVWDGFANRYWPAVYIADRRMRKDNPTAAGRGGTPGRRRRSGLRLSARLRGAGRLEEPGISRNVPRPPARFCVSRWCRA